MPRRRRRIVRWAQSAATCLAVGVAAAQAFAQAETATPTPARIYASVGDRFTFRIAYTGGPVTETDLVITYTSNTRDVRIKPTPRCVSAATPPPYASARPDEKYVWWEPASGTFPADCGGKAAAASFATFSGTVAAIPDGRYTIGLWNNAFFGAPDTPANDVIVCRKTTVSSVAPPADADAGTALTFTVHFGAAVPAGCGGFPIPVTLSGTATAAPGRVAIRTNDCGSVAEGATACTVVVQGYAAGRVVGSRVAKLSVTDATASSPYISRGNSASARILGTPPSATARRMR